MKARSSYVLAVLPDYGCHGCVFLSKNDLCTARSAIDDLRCGAGIYALVHKLTGEKVDPVVLVNKYKDIK